MDLNRLVTYWTVCICFLLECRADKPSQVIPDPLPDNGVSGEYILELLYYIGGK